MKTINPFDTRREFTRIHNYTLDHIMPSLKPNEWKVLCFVIRKTEGWGKDTETLSYSDIKKGTGIKSDPTLSAAIKGLMAKNYVLKSVGSGQWDANTYQLNTALEVKIDGHSTIENTAVPTIENTAVPTIENIAVSTIETKDNIKDTENKERKGGKKDSPQSTQQQSTAAQQRPPLVMPTAADRRQFQRPEMQYLDGLKSKVQECGLSMAQFVPMVNTILEKRGEMKLASQATRFGTDALRNAQETALSILLLDPERFGSIKGMESVFQSWKDNDYRGETMPTLTQLPEHAALMAAGREKENAPYGAKRTTGPTFTEKDYEPRPDEEPLSAELLATLDF